MLQLSLDNYSLWFREFYVHPVSLSSTVKKGQILLICIIKSVFNYFHISHFIFFIKSAGFTWKTKNTAAQK